MNNTKLIQYIHRPNATELGLGNTHETYMLVNSKTDLSCIFPPQVEVSVRDALSGKIYTLKATAGSEFRVNQMGSIYRDYNVLPGDEIVITQIDNGFVIDTSVFVRQFQRVVMITGNNGTEIVNIDRLEEFSNGEGQYKVKVYDRGVNSELNIRYKNSSKKRADSPNETVFYDVTIDGNVIPNGTYYITKGEKNTISTFLKSEFNIVTFNDYILNSSTLNEAPKKNERKEDKSKPPLQQIFYGAPGTGKSHTIKREVDEKQKTNFRVTFHPDSDYSTFVGCYKPTMKENVISKNGVESKEEQIVYRFVPQAFTKAYVAAWNTNDEVYLIIEEINRGNCAQIFGDLFQLLDRKNNVSEYPVDADSDLADYLHSKLKESTRPDFPEGVKEGKKLVLPSNLYIWATMNTSDQSLFPIDSAFKRRWEWKYIKIQKGKDENGQELNWMIDVKLKDANGQETQVSWWDFIQKINEIIASMTSSADKQLGYFFCKAKDGIIDKQTFVSKVIFYLWNDVFKDYDFDDASLFRYKDNKGEEKVLAFPDFYMDDDDEINDVRLTDFVQKVMSWKKMSDNKD